MSYLCNKIYEYKKFIQIDERSCGYGVAAKI